MSSFACNEPEARNGDCRVKVELPEDCEPKGFCIHPDAYGGLMVIASENPDVAADEFPVRLKNALRRWIDSGVKGVWFQVQLQFAPWIPVLVQNDFVFHHAKPDYAMMNRWLPEKVANPIPGFAHTYIAVGAIVVDDDNHVLAVRDKIPITAKKYLKLPGGHVDPGESMPVAAVREVKEETGIQAQFDSIVAFRHYQHGPFKTGDIYFICVLKALTKEIKTDDVEIEEACWIDIDEFMNHPDVSETNRFFLSCYLEKRERGAIGHKAAPLPGRKTVQDLYFVSPP